MLNVLVRRDAPASSAPFSDIPYKDHPNKIDSQAESPRRARALARAGKREMRNALSEGNGIAKHTACRYGNVSPPQVAFLSALSIDRPVRCIPLLFLPLRLRCYNTFITIFIVSENTINIILRISVFLFLDPPYTLGF